MFLHKPQPTITATVRNSLVLKINWQQNNSYVTKRMAFIVDIAILFSLAFTLQHLNLKLFKHANKYAYFENGMPFQTECIEYAPVLSAKAQKTETFENDGILPIEILVCKWD